MRLLYIFKTEPDETAQKILDAHKLSHDVTVVNLNEKTADELLDLIETHDKLIMW
jgi:hypothetical protein